MRSTPDRTTEIRHGLRWGAALASGYLAAVLIASSCWMHSTGGALR